MRYVHQAQLRPEKYAKRRLLVAKSCTHSAYITIYIFGYVCLRNSFRLVKVNLLLLHVKVMETAVNLFKRKINSTI